MSAKRRENATVQTITLPLVAGAVFLAGACGILRAERYADLIKGVLVVTVLTAVVVVKRIEDGVAIGWGRSSAQDHEITAIEK